MPTAGLELDGEETSSAADPPFCRYQERWDSNPQSNLYGGLKGRRGLERNSAGSSGSPGMGSSGASRGDAGTARGRRRLKVRKDAGAAPGTARKAMQIQQARQASQSLPGQRCRPSGLRSLKSFQMPAADTGMHVSFYRENSVYHLGLPQCPMPVSVSKAFG
ncbi:unnamed protein product [Coccothraustes coccothraustes]